MNALLAGAKSKKTFALGIIGLIALGAKIAESMVNGTMGDLDWTLIISTVTSSFAAIFARDANVTSEQAGA